MENMFTALLMGAIAFLIPIVYVGIMCKISNPFVLERKTQQDQDPNDRTKGFCLSHCIKNTK